MLWPLARIRRGLLCAATVSYAISGWSPAAFAWSAQGHEYIGNLGAQVLNPRARGEVAALLGPNITLGEAAVWPDCIRDVTGSANTQFRFRAGQFTPRVCRQEFDDDGAEENRMTDYARRNWTQCEYSGRRAECNLAYHFANVNIHNRSRYQLGYFGTGPQDVVQAIKAALTVLRCPPAQTCQVPAPFDIRDKREALFMLAHFVGDLHQPLHMGAVYLDPNGRPTGDDGRPTIGGNWLLLPSDDTLHSEWDTIRSGLGTSPSAEAIAAACRIAPRPDPVLEPAERWASESVRLARTAYAGMTYTPHATERGRWAISFANQSQYQENRRTTQARQLVTSAARLGAALNAVWPSSVRSPACTS